MLGHQDAGVGAAWQALKFPLKSDSRGLCVEVTQRADFPLATTHFSPVSVLYFFLKRRINLRGRLAWYQTEGGL